MNIPQVLGFPSSFNPSMLNKMLIIEFHTPNNSIPCSCSGAMGPKTFEILSAPHGLERNPDTVDDFYRLCSRYIQHVGSRLVIFISS